MSQFPIEVDDQQALADSVNYLLSGPGGLGQNFEGFSAYLPGYLTGNFRRPYSVKSVQQIAQGLSGEFTITVPSNSGISVGNEVVGTNIVAGTLVTAITFVSSSEYIITLDTALTGDLEDALVLFTPSASQIPSLYVPPIACSSAVKIDDRTFQYNFSSAQPAPPFALGNNIRGSGWTDGFYNGGVGAIGVVKCTTTEVIFQTAGSYPTQGDDFGGGFVRWDANNQLNSTDCNARVTISGGTDRVFISGQLNDTLTYSAATGGNLTYLVQINRYRGFPNNDPVNPDFLFDFDRTVSSKTYIENGLTGTGTLSPIETVFSTVIDEPPPGFFWYILEVDFQTTGDLYITQAEFNLRSLSAQVVKQ